MRRVFFDPDGTDGAYLGVVVEYPSGVLYVHQCAGLENEERSVEGYFVPLGGLTFDAHRRLEPLKFRGPFHNGASCAYGGAPRSRSPNYSQLPGKRLEALMALVAEVPWWSGDGASDTTARTPLALDEGRLGEIVEGWVPIVTPDGKGILIWPNCD